MNIKDELFKIIHSKIKEIGLREYRSQYARKQLVKICKEAIADLKITGAETEKWEAFVKQVFK